jgi:hypothetical protein
MGRETVLSSLIANFLDRLKVRSHRLKDRKLVPD